MFYLKAFLFHLFTLLNLEMYCNFYGFDGYRDMTIKRRVNFLFHVLLKKKSEELNQSKVFLFCNFTDLSPLNCFI